MGKTFAIIETLSISVWITIVGLSFANYTLRFIRWDSYVVVVSGIRIDKFKHFLIYLVGFSLTTTPGKAGEGLRSFYLKPFGVGYKESISVLFVERLLDLLAITMMAILFAVYFEDEKIRLTAFFCGVFILLILPLIHSKKLWQLVALIGTRCPLKIKNLIAHLIDMVKSSSLLLKNRILYTGLGIAVVAWVLEGIGLYVVLQFLSVDCSLMLAIGIYAVAVLVGVVSFMPGGLGGTEAVMVVLLMAIGADKATALAATLVCRAVTLWFAVLVGILSGVSLLKLGIVPQIFNKEVSSK